MEPQEVWPYLYRVGEVVLAWYGRDALDRAGRELHRRVRGGARSPIDLIFERELTFHYVRVTDERNRLGCFAHVLVHNASDRPLLRCVGRLASVSRRREGREGGYAPNLFYRPMVLKWAGEQGLHPIEIPPRGSALLDLCHAVDGVDCLRLAVARDQGVPTELERGIYRLRVAVTADEVEGAESSYMVVFDGRWHAFNVVRAPDTEPLPVLDLSMIRTVDLQTITTRADSLSSTSNPQITIVELPPRDPDHGGR